MSTKTFQLLITVHKSAIDQMGHVNNVQYLQWVQDVAEAHWKANATKEILAEYAWVALEHQIKYHAPAFAGEEVILETWVEQFEGVKSLRKTRIFRPTDEKTLVTASTQWCLLKMPSGRPARIPKEFLELYERANGGK